MFRPALRQVRNLALFTAGVAVIAAALLMVHFGTRSDPGGRLLGYGVGAGLGSLIGGWCLVCYSRAFTECGPDGIRTRGLGRKRRCAWDEVSDIAIRAYHGRGATTYTVRVTTASGQHFALGAPVSGGIMPDPEFEGKVRQIRACWHAAAGGRAGAGGTPVIPVFAAAYPEWLSAGVVLRGCVTLVLVAAVAAVPFAVPAGGPALLARLGQGQPGSYTPYAYTCTPACYWTGEFAARGGSRHRDGMTIAPGLGTAQVGDPVPAVYAGDPSMVYPAGGGTAWIPVALLAAIIVICGPLEAVWFVRWRRRRNSARQEHAPLPARRPGRARRAGGTWRAAGVIMLPAVTIVVLAGGGGALATIIQAIPPTPSAKALACTDYAIWLETENPADPSYSAAVLARADREAPAGPLRWDMDALRFDVNAEISAKSTSLAISAGENLINETQTVTTDCS